MHKTYSAQANLVITATLVSSIPWDCSDPAMQRVRTFPV